MQNPLTIFKDIVNIIYPDLCLACEEPLTAGEKIICLACQLTLPATDYHTYADNPVAKHFWGKINIEAATAMYHFHKSSRIQHALHQLKYKGRKDIGIRLGKLFGYQLSGHEIFSKADFITSVPLHADKLRKRGYNQADMLGSGLSETLQIPFDNKIVYRTKFTETQTRKSRLARWKNVESIFAVTDEKKIQNKHIFIIDDVITTGSTLESCAAELLKIEGVQVSIAAIAHAEM